MEKIKRIVLLLTVLVPISLFSQEGEKGIQFIQQMNWKQIKKKAKVENKYIFIDFFTTWCGPCREMDKNVYPMEKVGDFFNANFIAVKVQVDTTLNDNEQVRSWYSDGRELSAQYKVDVYPTYLFFSPDGKIVHRSAGGCSAAKFILLAKDAMDTARQYYTELAKYDPNKMSLPQMKKMADSLRYRGPELAQKIAIDYMDRQSQNDLYNKENLAFIGRFNSVPLMKQLAGKYISRLTINDLTRKDDREFIIKFKALPEARQLADVYITGLQGSDLHDFDNTQFIASFMEKPFDVAFNIYYRSSKIIDETAGTGYAEGWIEGIISKEEVSPLLEAAMKPGGVIPNWDKLHKGLGDKFGDDYAGRVVSRAKCTWYTFIKNHKEFFKSQMLLYDKYGSVTSGAFDLNNAAWQIFLESNDTAELTEALSWSERAVKAEPIANWMDTYANLLYKLGRDKGAIRWEEVAVKLEPDNKNFLSNLRKMKSKETTWVSK